ncbi:peptidase m56 family protein [Myxococcus stipitatus DSM 14675]|uniref:Peptidase m56 family protein n=1 Tax=Myxococcus stipitatus (strain DSM 14675 / JCM 12634 / Mx s8) TaxID=1278073 RepID=L7UL54_MYXSD|nr:M56 family metallopeptidase [Myxococcus stipitatus]AGC48630.1 peptidase m56 family protein [Myxococcus stipitatus DSM 14675]
MRTDWLTQMGSWLSSWPEGLWRASWQGALCAALVWAVTRGWTRMPASLRAGLWWLVALKFVVTLVAVRPLAVPLLPATLGTLLARVESPAPEHAPREVAPSSSSPKMGELRVMLGGPEVVVMDASVATPAARSTGALAAEGAGARESERSMGAFFQDLKGLKRVLLLLLLGAWVVGLLWQVRHQVRSWALMRQVRRSARPLVHPELEEEVRELSVSAGLRQAPALLVSDAVTSPLATGLLSPVVVLPAKAVRLMPVEGLRMALAHEVAHLKRGDLWLGWVPALAEALLFFHPLARRAAREYALAREEACDAEALRLTGAEPADYGELLLAFGVARSHGTAAALGASAHVDALYRRLSMLEHVEVDSSLSRRGWKWAFSLFGLLALVPFQVVARQESKPETRPDTAAAAPVATTRERTRMVGAVMATSPATPVPPAPPVVAPAPVAAAPAQVRVAPRAPVAPATPRTPPPMVAVASAVPATPPTPPKPPRYIASEDDFGYVLLDGDSATMSGSTVDLQLAKMFQGKKDGELLYVRRKGEAFIVRDEATLKALQAALEPMRARGASQGALGEKMGALGHEQGKLGLKQGALGVKQSELALRHAELAHKRAGLHLESNRIDSLPEAERDRRQAELDKQEEALDKEMDALDTKREAIDQEQEALGREQAKLGEQQAALGREMAKVSEQTEDEVRDAEKAIRALIDEALRKGLGKPLPT